MSHSEMNLQLADYAAGGLEPKARGRLEEHLTECADCAEWLATYRLLSSGIETDTHPSSRLIAEFALAADNVSQFERGRILDHLETCTDCAREVDLSRKAVRAARAEPAWQAAADADRKRPFERLQLWARTQVESPMRLAAAAGLILAVVIGTGVLLSPADSGGSSSTTALHGTSVLEAGDQILMADTSVEKGADVTVRAGTVVALGEGFSVASDASLTIELEKRGPEL